MQKRNVNIDNSVSTSFHTTQTQNYISPTTTSLPSTTIDDQFIAHNITLFKPLELTGINNSNPCKALLTAQQKLDNLQQQIEDRIIYCKATEKRK